MFPSPLTGIASPRKVGSGFIIDLTKSLSLANISLISLFKFPLYFLEIQLCKEHGKGDILEIQLLLSLLQIFL